jgi:dTMP kinase
VPQPRPFIVLEGLSCVGKSTIAPLLAQALDAVLVPTLVAEFERVRKRVDEGCSASARLHFWMMANYTVAGQVRRLLGEGRAVVLESYFHRSLATHAAIGVSDLPNVDWACAVQPDITVLLTLDELVRQHRLRERARTGGLSRWAGIEEGNVDQARRMYESFGLTTLDTTGKTPRQVVCDVVSLVDTSIVPS